MDSSSLSKNIVYDNILSHSPSIKELNVFLSFSHNISTVAELSLECDGLTLTGVAQWAGHCLTDPKVTSLIPGQGSCLGGKSGRQLGAGKR